MTLLLALVIATLFGAGVLLVLERDLVRMAAGTLLMSQSANLLLMGVALQRGRAPLLPAAPLEVTDPLVQALTLTAVVISFGTTALLLALVMRVSATHDTIAVEDVMAAEEEQERESEGEAP